jgi:FKBP-type peptidyl-prolyl cis-trans isomerase 2
MTQAKDGDKVLVHYEGKLEDGTVFGKSELDQPLEFTLGMNEIIPGFEKAVFGMSIGESKTITIGVEEAYGPYQPDLVMEVDRDLVPPHMEVETGQVLQLRQEDGEEIPVKVTEISEETMTLDGNHPLAGHDLTFSIELVNIDS